MDIEQDFAQEPQAETQAEKPEGKKPRGKSQKKTKIRRGGVSIYRAGKELDKKLADGWELAE